jgi:hypothetical protein
MTLTGTPWLKRAGTGSVSGLIGDDPGSAGSVGVGPVSTVDQAYVSPPGITDVVAEKTDALRLSGVAINEQSLRLTFTDIPVGERVEVFRRFTQRPRDFLPYGRLRAWTLPLEGDWSASTRRTSTCTRPRCSRLGDPHPAGTTGFQRISSTSSGCWI